MVEGQSLPAQGSVRPTFTVDMVLPDGTRYVEEGYDGYGEFGGKDFFESVAELNGMSGRDDGISLYHAAGVAKILPRLTRSRTKKWEELSDPEDCPDQGYFYDE